MRNLVVCLSFAWSFGIFVFGHLWRFHSVICDLQIIVCCLKPPIMSQILRKQCVNILFLLGVFYNIQRKSHFYKTLIFRTLSEQRNIMEYHFAILIIWRSLVQAQAGPHRNTRSYANRATPFFMSAFFLSTYSVFNLSNLETISSSYACFCSSLRKDSCMSCCHLGSAL